MSTMAWSKRVPRPKCHPPAGCEALRNTASVFIPSIPGETGKAIVLTVMLGTPVAAQPRWGRTATQIAIMRIRASGISSGGTIHSLMKWQAFDCEQFMLSSSAGACGVGVIYIMPNNNITIDMRRINRQ
ncbi:hypothetical protein amb3657 [Paramagnetospirillum magneticum AMB-1]|uniref:Uncharacterized protein n=1 Tax=Paramagnetospirillum magneticum (strain ATCC 700264 / AMB-1) TaxID=342108 RepID=Q2W114_PARM1|nr:hypothetical protein amb3657 [Paramagnetospirillum magneticum AMB-1]